MAQLTTHTQAINDLPDSAFAYIEPGGSKDSEGKTTPRELRHFPLHDKAHVQNALSRAPQSPFGDKAMPKIRAAAQKMGIEVADASRSRPLEDTWSDVGQVITRSIALDDMAMRSGRITCDTCHRDATGRMVDAYMARFLPEEAEIHDEHGHYWEGYDPGSWNRRLEHLSRSRAGLLDVGVYYNHAMTIHNTPAEMFSVPLGHPAAIKPDGSGMVTSTHYGTDEFQDRILTGVKEGNIAGQSFTGRIYASDPQRVPRVTRSRDLPHVRRLQMGLTEYGPTPVPYFEGAKTLAVRSRGGDDIDEPAPVPAGPTYEDVRSRAARRALLVRRMVDNR